METILCRNPFMLLAVALMVCVLIALCLLLRQNTLRREEAQRPYVTLTYAADKPESDKPSGRFILKNCGATACVMTRFQYPEVLNTQVWAAQYAAVRGMEIAPGQSVVLPCANPMWDTQEITFRLIYHAPVIGKNYSDSVSFQTALLDHLDAE